MSLLNSLYHITATDEHEIHIRFDANHPVFAGHFPGAPVVPGACLVQIAEELLAQQLQHPAQITGIHNLKFRQTVTPDMPVTFHITLQEDNKCAVLITHIDTPNVQFTATYLCAHSNV